ncbi:MAG TPA: hypothetical protein VLQ45_13975 [Thermoanaerobaculia bacterium]|nr:hypothetical protein [Thermoanaerobaculia bacterium]
MRSVRVLPLVLVLLAVSFPSLAQTPLGPEFRVNVRTGGEQRFLQVAMNARGDFVVVWSSRESAWDEYSLYARRFAADGTPATDEIPVLENTFYSAEVAVAVMEDGSFVVVYAAYSDAQPGSATFHFEGRRFAADGSPLGGPFAIGTGHAAADLSAASRPGGGFVVAWEAYRTTPEISVRIRIFDGNGSPVRNEISLAEGNDPALAVGPDGEIVVAWMAVEPGDDHGRYFVVAQRLSKNGALRGQRFVVSRKEERFVDAIRVAKDGTGSFSVFWNEDFGSLGPGAFFRRYSWKGVRLTGIKRLASWRLTPAIAMEENGDFVMVWSEEKGAGDPDVFWRRFRALGQPAGWAFRANTTRPGDQEWADVAGDGAGNFVVVWLGEEQDGSGSGVFARLYRRP